MDCSSRRTTKAIIGLRLCPPDLAGTALGCKKGPGEAARTPYIASDLLHRHVLQMKHVVGPLGHGDIVAHPPGQRLLVQRDVADLLGVDAVGLVEIGRASGRERVCQYGEISVGAVALKKKTRITQN